MIKDLVQEYREKIKQAIAEEQYLKMQGLFKEFSAQVRLIPEGEDEIADKFFAFVDDPCQDVRLWFNAAFQHPSKRYIEPLCTMLSDSRDCVLHETIVDLLYEIEDPRSIPSLRTALAYERSDDPTNELAIKILETLEKIGTPEALDILRSSLKDPRPRVREEAELLLEEHDRAV